MPIDYGTDRVFVDVQNCESCGGSHKELEFKRMGPIDLLGAPTNETHRGRCSRTKQWLYRQIKETSDAPRADRP
jgi:hypothetical protein